MNESISPCDVALAESGDGGCSWHAVTAVYGLNNLMCLLSKHPQAL